MLIFLRFFLFSATMEAFDLCSLLAADWLSVSSDSDFDPEMCLALLSSLIIRLFSLGSCDDIWITFVARTSSIGLLRILPSANSS